MSIYDKPFHEGAIDALVMSIVRCIRAHQGSIEKAGLVSLKGRTEISEASRHDDAPGFLFSQIIEESTKEH